MPESTSSVIPFPPLSRDELLLKNAELAERFGRHVTNGLIDGARPLAYIEHNARMAFHHARVALAGIPDEAVDDIDGYLDSLRTRPRGAHAITHAFGLGRN